MEVVQLVIDDSTNKTITGQYVWSRGDGGVLVVPAGDSFPGTPVAKELFWRTDEDKLYRRNDGDTAWDTVVATPTAHASSHEDGGSDEIEHQDLAGAGGYDHADLDDHVDDEDNPHAVTAAQTGAITEVADDTSPKLGGDLDIYTYKLIGTSTGGTKYLFRHNDHLNIIVLGEDATPNNIAVIEYRATYAHGFYVGGNHRGGIADSGVHTTRTFYYTSEYQINESAPVTSDFSVDFNANGGAQAVTLGASVSITSITFPTGVTRCVLRIKQDGTGSRTLSLPSAVKAPGGKSSHFVLSTAPNAIDIATFYYDSNTANVVLCKDFKV